MADRPVRTLQTIIAARYDGDPQEAEQMLASTLRRLEWRARRGHKRCDRCREDKKPSAFGIDARNPDGLHRVCRDCRRARLS